VRQGETVSALADSLQRQGIINSGLLFRLDARLQNLSGKLKVGDYRIRRNMSIDDMVSAFTVFHDRKIKILIPEGFRAEQIAAVLQAHGINGQQFLQQVRHPTLSLSILGDKPAGRSLEGYLFPNTYDVPPHYGARDFAQLMILTLGKNFTPAMRHEAARQHRSIYDVLTLASIVEREAKVDSDRPKIASVFLNRLRQGISLYSDPTVQYAAGTPSKWWPVLRDSPSNVQPQSPYNTYTHGGLPPGPISNPGLLSIEAALNPAPTDFLYFVAMNVPPGTDEAGYKEFNDFYTNIHVPEVVSISKFVRGHRYHLYREFARSTAPDAEAGLKAYALKTAQTLAPR